MEEGRVKQCLWTVAVFVIVALVVYFISGNTTIEPTHRLVMSGALGLIGGVIAWVFTGFDG